VARRQDSIAIFNAGNAKGVADLYTKDAFFSNSAAGTMIGQEAIEKNFENTIKQGWKISISLKDARMVKPDVLTAVGEYTFTGSGPSEGKKVTGNWGTTDMKAEQSRASSNSSIEISWRGVRLGNALSPSQARCWKRAGSPGFRAGASLRWLAAQAAVGPVSNRPLRRRAVCQQCSPAGTYL
jgi:uncharacterized protein (TIGR02246 family)